ncbi:hypothetical protein HPP92_022668 [Vanilla planifolia]|uniref:Uncharacterized protein n=1 Tax=Vanilla planifolia TaxID=51239 RepID=A0A835PVT8_VANPL|nr:hypothetical protein HPP92_022960 [Vanilla planifolia]KAG0459540.1 hypothetical protein HPP92_022668 [Vanilla planifolia]
MATTQVFSYSYYSRYYSSQGKKCYHQFPAMATTQLILSCRSLQLSSQVSSWKHCFSESSFPLQQTQHHKLSDNTSSPSGASLAIEFTSYKASQFKTDKRDIRIGKVSIIPGRNLHKNPSQTLCTSSQSTKKYQ